jgi:hypothetical protein
MTLNNNPVKARPYLSFHKPIIPVMKPMNAKSGIRTMKTQMNEFGVPGG